MFRSALRGLGNFWSLVGGLALLSAFFTHEVETFKTEVARTREATSVPDGTHARVVEVVSSSEVLVRLADGRTLTVRLIGVVSFDPTSHEPGESQIGRSFASALHDALSTKDAVIAHAETKRDRKGRLLAHLTVGGDDVARTLIARGLGFVNAAASFDKEEDYLKAEGEAKLSGRGLWGNREATRQVRWMKALWEAGRKDV
jgi:endonuclease YncB( thermonuclease family)